MKKGIKVLLIAVLAVLVCLLAFSAWKFFSTLGSYNEGVEVYDEIKDEYRTVRSSAAEKKTGDGTGNSGVNDGETSGQPDYSAFEKEGQLTLMGVSLDYVLTPLYDFDFEKLCGANEDVRGWIIIPDTNIDYPIVQSADNTEYLRRAVDGTQNNCGSIFIDCRTADAFHQSNTIIYGHNQRNSRMFHDLLKYEEADFAEQHPYVEIYETDGTHHLYQIFSAHLTDSVSATYAIGFSTPEEFQAYLDREVSESMVDFQVPVSSSDTVITLSTCTNEWDSERFVVLAKKMN